MFFTAGRAARPCLLGLTQHNKDGEVPSTAPAGDAEFQTPNPDFLSPTFPGRSAAPEEQRSELRCLPAVFSHRGRCSGILCEPASLGG